MKDYSQIIKYLLENWTNKEVQTFVDKVASTIHLLEMGNYEFRKTALINTRVIVIQKQVSMFYRINTSNCIEIIRLWDNRQNPAKLKKS